MDFSWTTTDGWGIENIVCFLSGEDIVEGSHDCGNDGSKRVKVNAEMKI